METEHDPDSDSPLVRSSRALLAFAMVKAAGVIVAIPSVVLGGFMAHAAWNRQMIPPAWTEWSIGCLILGILCDAVGRIGCWWICRGSSGRWSFVASLISQWIAIAALLYQTWIGWTPLSVQAQLGIFFAVIGQSVAALLFTNGLMQLALEQRWTEVEQQVMQLTRLLGIIPSFLASWLGVLGCLAVLSVIQVLLILWFVPKWLWMGFYLTIATAAGGVVFLGLLFCVEIKYLHTLWKICSAIQSEQASDDFDLSHE